jgi:hypothetical protein
LEQLAILDGCWSYCGRDVCRHRLVCRWLKIPLQRTSEYAEPCDDPGMVNWSTTELYNDFVMPMYNADIVTVVVRGHDGHDGLAVVPSHAEAADIHRLLNEELNHLEQTSGGTFTVREDGYQNDLGGAVCVLHYIVEHSGEGLVGGAAMALAGKLALVVRSQIVQYNDRDAKWFDPYAELSEQHVRWCAKVLTYEIFGDDLKFHIDEIVLSPDAKPPVASATMTASDDSIIKMEIEFANTPVGVLKAVTRTHRYR